MRLVIVVLSRWFGDGGIVGYSDCYSCGCIADYNFGLVTVICVVVVLVVVLIWMRL